MHLFDVVDALDILKIEKNEYFCIFFVLTTFSDIFPDVADIFIFRPSTIFCRCRRWQHRF
jgi:hypothetical protein